MTSKYLQYALDIKVGDAVIVDDDESDPVTIKHVGNIFVICETSKGYNWEVMRNRITKKIPKQERP